jgi:hypothetical protein
MELVRYTPKRINLMVFRRQAGGRSVGIARSWTKATELVS